VRQPSQGGVAALGSIKRQRISSASTQALGAVHAEDASQLTQLDTSSLPRTAEPTIRATALVPAVAPLASAAKLCCVTPLPPDSSCGDGVQARNHLSTAINFDNSSECPGDADESCQSPILCRIPGKTLDSAEVRPVNGSEILKRSGNEKTLASAAKTAPATTTR